MISTLYAQDRLNPMADLTSKKNNKRRARHALNKGKDNSKFFFLKQLRERAASLPAHPFNPVIELTVGKDEEEKAVVPVRAEEAKADKQEEVKVD